MAVELLPAASLAVTVMVLEPELRVILEMLQLVEPVAVPLPPLSLVQLMPDRPLPESEALPLKFRVLVMVL